jgi:ferredoxin-NADP reductase
MNDEAEGVLELRVMEMTYQADGVVGLQLADPDGAALPAWRPGAHIDLYSPEHVRQYSLCSDPADRLTYGIAVLREKDSRGGSEYVHASLRVGDLVEVGGPRNHFELEPAEEYIFIAGGIGITPLLPMIAEASRQDIPWNLYYTGRALSSMAFRGELAAYTKGTAHFIPRDLMARIDLTAILATPKAGAAIYTCGPTGLLDAVEQKSQHWPPGSLHLERFASKDLSGLESRPVQIDCKRTGISVDVPAHQSILDGLESAGITVPNACRDGVCGSCEVTVIEGEVEHRDSLQRGTSPENSLMVCVSRACGDRLVLDI